jgi:putative SOS response-associated peptidase YedK
VLRSCRGARDAGGRADLSWQRAPGGSAWLLRRDFTAGQRRIGRFRWGLLQHWTDDPGPREATCLIADDRVDRVPYARALLARRRGLVLVGAYVEWQVDDFGLKQPYSVSREDGGMFALAAVWEKLPFGRGGNGCFALLTVTANAALAPLHPRMPAVIAEGDWAGWLGESLAAPSDYLRPAENTGWQVQRIRRAEVAVPPVRGRVARPMKLPEVVG